MCAAVALPESPENEPDTDIVLAPRSMVTVAVADPVLEFEGTSCPPLSVTFKICGPAFASPTKARQTIDVRNRLRVVVFMIPPLVLQSRGCSHPALARQRKGAARAPQSEPLSRSGHIIGRSRDSDKRRGTRRRTGAVPV